MGKRYEQGGPELNSALFRDYGPTGRIYRDRLYGYPEPRAVFGAVGGDMDEGDRLLGIRFDNPGPTTTVRVAACAEDGTESATATYTQSCPTGTTTVGNPPGTGSTAIPMRKSKSKPGLLTGFNTYTG